MHPLLNKPATARYSKRHHQFDPWEGQSSGGREDATGNVYNIQIRAVCETCNNGWMNRLEGEARPFLEPLVTGEAVALDSEQMHKIAEWLALKSMVMEHGAPDAAVTTRYYREMFRYRREIPHFYRIYLACHSGEPIASSFRESRCIALSPIPSPPLGGVANNVQTLIIIIGRVFAVIHAARVDNFSIEQGLAIPKLYTTSRIWPPDHHELVWPREPIFTFAQIDEIALGLNKLIAAQKTIWLRDK